MQDTEKRSNIVHEQSAGVLKIIDRLDDIAEQRLQGYSKREQLFT